MTPTKVDIDRAAAHDELVDAFAAGHEAPKAKGWVHPEVPWNGLTVTDLFCGAGGSSSGLVQAGYRVVIAANHWALAIASHQINHPDTDHTSADISQVDPRYFPTTDILWASPECTNHSVAKGVKRQKLENEALFELGERLLPDEAANRSRATMWDVPRFAEHHRYKAIVIENVVDAYRWIMFPAWLQAMELLGYRHQIVWLNSMHAQGAGLPAPQSRDRMYIVFWRADLVTKKRPAPRLDRWTRPYALCLEHGEIRAVQAFKKAEAWGRYRAQYVYRCPKCAVIVEPAWMPALDILDMSIPGQRIGDRKRPLALKTRVRIEKAIDRYWRPVVVTAAGNTYDSASGKPGTYLRARPADDVLPTQHTTVAEGIAFPPLLVRGEGNTTPAKPASDPLGAVTAAGSQFLATPLLVPVEGRDGVEARRADGPLRTQTARLVDAIVVPMRNHSVAKPADEPIDTVAAGGNHHALVMTNNHGNRARPADEPLPTATTATVHALLMRNNQGGAEMSTPVDEPMRTLTTGGHQSLLVPYSRGNEIGRPVTDPLSTLTTRDRFGLAEGFSLDVDDVLFRMLEPHEIKLGMAFPADYVLEGTKREQVKQSGNAVTPPAARDLGRAVAEFLVPELWELAA